MADPSDDSLIEIEAALVRWKALTILGDLQRRAYQEQAAERPDEGERLYRDLSIRLAIANQQLRAQLTALRGREWPEPEE